MKAEDEAGFTLLEIVIVTAMLSAVIISTPPMLKWLKHQGVRHAVRQLQADLQLARITAICRKRTCTIAFNRPQLNQYMNMQNNRIGELNSYLGNVHFLTTGPDDKKMTEQVSYNRQGMNTTVVPANIFLTGDDNSEIYRIRIMLPGGISVHRWTGKRWQ